VNSIDGSAAGAGTARTVEAIVGDGRVLLDSQSPQLRLIISSPDAAASAPRLPSLERLQWEYIHAVLGSCAGNVSEAARQLGMHRQSLQRMLRRNPPSR
jgi:transcriptional regulator of acetoin/glycerol metabolism